MRRSAVIVLTSILVLGCEPRTAEDPVAGSTTEAPVVEPTDTATAGSTIDPSEERTTDPSEEPVMEGTGGPHDEAAVERPDLMVVEPATLRPGDSFELYYPQETNRGTPFALERIQDGQPVFVYMLTSAPDGAGEPRWTPAESDWSTYDVRIRGPGPDLLQLPDELPAGEYRLCTINRGDGNICTGQFTVGE